jgi:hypothetical protein
MSVAGSQGISEPPFHHELQQAAANYRTWGRVDDQMRWAPWLCCAPRAAQARESDSKDEMTHGQKLYSIYAKNHSDYVGLAKDKKPELGQVVVKQSWTPVIVIGDEAATARKHAGYPVVGLSTVQISESSDAKGEASGKWDSFFPYVVKDDKVYKAAKQADLFIMMKFDSRTPNTDEGWVYGTVTPDGKTVATAGRVASCMKCHRDAKYDRLFGLAKTK